MNFAEDSQSKYCYSSPSPSSSWFLGTLPVVGLLGIIYLSSKFFPSTLSLSHYFPLGFLLKHHRGKVNKGEEEHPRAE